MKVTFIPIIIDALGTVTDGLSNGLEDLKIRGQVKTIQTTISLRSARILRRVLETCCRNKSCIKKLSRSKILLSITIIIIIIIILIN